MPHLLGLHPLDAAVVIGSLVIVVVIGLLASRNVHGEGDFFVSGRSMGAWLQFFINFGQATDSNGAPTIATEVYRSGASGMWIGFQTLLATPFIWFTSIWFRRARVITGPDLFIERFGSKKLATFYAWFGLLQIPLQLGLGNIISYKVAAATMIKPESAYTQVDHAKVTAFREYEQLRDQFVRRQLPASDQPRYEQLLSQVRRGEIAQDVSYVTPLPFYIGYTLIVASYILLGGIKAAAITDAFQGLLIIFFSVMMLPIGLSHVGGLSGLHQKVPETHFALFGGSSDYTWFSIAAIVAASLVTFAAPTGPTFAAAKNEKSLRLGLLSGLFCKRFIMIAWMMCGLLAAAMFGGQLADPDNAWGTLAKALLPPGLMGLMISGMLLGHMPAVGVNAINFSATFTRNLYEPMRPGRGERHYLMVAKLSTLGVLILGLLFALFFSGVISLLTALITFSAYFGAVGFLTYFWRRLTSYAVGIGATVWILLMVVAAYLLPLAPGFTRLPLLTRQTQAFEIKINVPATDEDVKAGRAEKIGQAVPSTRVVPPAAMFFESVVRSDPMQPNSPLEGIGRFQVETFILHSLGLPLQNYGPAGLLTCRWLFDGALPFVLLIPLSLLTLRRESRERADATGDPAEPLSRDPYSVQFLPIRPSAGQTEREIRISRFYAKMKTPVAETPEADAAEVKLSFENPSRFDHTKLFGPRSQWEFAKWTWGDYAGFFGCWAGVGLVLAFLLLLLNAGAN